MSTKTYAAFRASQGCAWRPIPGEYPHADGSEGALAEWVSQALGHVAIVRDEDDCQRVLADGWFDSSDYSDDDGEPVETAEQFAARLFAEAAKVSA